MNANGRRCTTEGANSPSRLDSHHHSSRQGCNHGHLSGAGSHVPATSLSVRKAGSADEALDKVWSILVDGAANAE